MTVFHVSEAQADLAALQDYMLAKWGSALCDQALEEVYDQMDALDQGKLNGVPVVELIELGIDGYLMTQTSHHRIIYKQVGGNTYVYIVAGQRQDFLQVLETRLMQMR
ncbi:MAG TPA: type II toxin-antitoxin system RelE/ParE family toxin [Bordetella sp.]